MPYQHAAGLLLVVLATLFPFVYRGRSWPAWSLTDFVAPAALMTAGLGLLDWRLLLALAATVGAVAGWVGWTVARDRRYARRFPVFQSPPIGTVTHPDGFQHHLHLVQGAQGFLIGIRYETEVDLTPMTLETRWEDVFPDAESARRELHRRLESFIPPDGAQGPSNGGQPPDPAVRPRAPRPD